MTNLDLLPDWKQTTHFKTNNVCDLDLDAITFVLKLDLDIMVTYLHTKLRSIYQIVHERGQ